VLSYEELHHRAALFRIIRDFFHQQHFLEIDTPVRHPVLIPEANISPLESEAFFLQTSPELCMKRLLALGCSRIFQICRCFRREERGRHHLEEFTMLEWYRSGADYLDLMDDCEALVCCCLDEMRRWLSSAGMEDSLFASLSDRCKPTRPWRKIAVKDAFARWSEIPLERALAESLFDEILVEKIEPRLGAEGPVFLYDYPLSMASLAKRKDTDDTVAERFELYLDGVELANGFSELTDPDEQRERFVDEVGTIAAAGGREMALPEKFLADLEKLDTCAGVAFGLDRFCMLLLGKNDIHDAVPFSPRDL
jgi:lysyl-tRNA synthetase class 2